MMGIVDDTDGGDRKRVNVGGRDARVGGTDEFVAASWLRSQAAGVSPRAEISGTSVMSTSHRAWSITPSRYSKSSSNTPRTCRSASRSRTTREECSRGSTPTPLSVHWSTPSRCLQDSVMPKAKSEPTGSERSSNQVVRSILSEPRTFTSDSKSTRVPVPRSETRSPATSRVSWI